jgi:hypothetical protein
MVVREGRVDKRDKRFPQVRVNKQGDFSYNDQVFSQKPSRFPNLTKQDYRLKGKYIVF